MFLALFMKKQALDRLKVSLPVFWLKFRCSFCHLTLHMKNDIFGFANIKRHFVSNEPVGEFSEFVLDTGDE